MWWAPHRLGCLPSGRQAAADYTFGNLAHKMPTGHLSWNAEDTADSNGPRHRHRRCGFAGVWLGNLENIQLGYKGYRSSPLLQGFQSGRTSAPLGRGLGSEEGVGGASSIVGGAFYAMGGAYSHAPQDTISPKRSRLFCLGWSPRSGLARGKAPRACSLQEALKG